MPLDPEPGLVIRYDFLWKHEEKRGQEQGVKDRSCAVVLATKPKEDGSRTVMLAPITHSPPRTDETAIEVPAKVGQHLGLDDDRSWIKTHQVNTLTWPKDQIPFGVVQTKQGDWSQGMLPDKLSEKVFNQVRENAQERTLQTIARDQFKAVLDRKSDHDPDNGMDR